MLVKKYEAKDMKQAMNDIVKELGTDAVILNSRKIRKPGLAGMFRAPLMEVMVAYEPNKPSAGPAKKQPLLYTSDLEELLEPAPPAVSPPPVPAFQPPASAAEQAATQQAQDALNELDVRINSLDHVLMEFMDKFSYLKRDITYDFPEEIERLFLTMTANQVQGDLALALAKQAAEILRNRPEAAPQEVMHHLILEALCQSAPIYPKKYQQNVILMLGPTGVGKTTSLVKLASNFAIQQKKRVGIINTDTYRIGAHEQLKTYADILDIPLGIAYRPAEVEQALKDLADRDVIFIDTAGKRPGDTRHQEEISQIIKIARPEDILLCVALPTAYSSMQEIVNTYNFTGAYKLLVTKLDETKYRGMILNLCHYAKRPLAYVTTGQNVPDDMETVNPEQIASQILER